jgi:molybdopterin converting factor small subunit
MAEKKEKLYLELQMEELKAEHAENAGEEASSPKKNTRDNSKNAEIAKMYEDAAEYEEGLKAFEEELEIVNANALKDIAAALIQKFPNEERDYAQELNTVLEMGWTHLVEVEKTHPKEQLEVIKETEFGDVVEKLNAAYPDYTGDFEADVRNFLVKRWENLISITKDHLKEELAEIKTTGLKPKYVKRVYEQFHGIAK